MKRKTKATAGTDTPASIETANTNVPDETQKTDTAEDAEDASNRHRQRLLY